MTEQRAACLLTLVLLLVGGYAYAPLPTDLPRNATFARMPLPQEIVAATAEQKEPKSFYMFYKNLGLTVEIAQYTGITYASRFPSLWFLPGLYIYEEKDRQGLLSEAERTAYLADKDRFGRMIAEDLTRYQPEIVLILSPDAFDGLIDMPEFFEDQKDFSTAWAQYKFERYLRVDEKLYYGRKYPTRGAAEFHVYRRKG